MSVSRLVHCSETMPALSVHDQPRLAFCCLLPEIRRVMPNARPAPDDLAASLRKRGLAGLVSDLRKAASRGPRDWSDLLRAVAELARARIIVGSVAPARLGILGHGDDGAGEALTPAQARHVDRVAYAVNVMSLRVPWRSDCLIRAVAARRWLAAGGVASRIGVGARHDEQGAFMAHAWLTVGERIVTGGDTTPYGEFVRASRDEA